MISIVERLTRESRSESDVTLAGLPLPVTRRAHLAEVARTAASTGEKGSAKKT